MKHIEKSQLSNIIFGMIGIPNCLKDGHIKDIWDNICMKDWSSLLTTFCEFDKLCVN